MTPKVIHVSSDASLSEVCQLMGTERIHRVFVVEDEKPVCVVSTLDIVTFLGRG